MMILVTILYYFKNIYLNIISLLIAIVYSYITNKNLIKDIKNMLKEKLHK